MENNESNLKNKSYAKLLGVLVLFIAVIAVVVVSVYTKGNTPEKRAVRNLEKSIKVMMTFPDPGVDAFYKEQNGTASVDEISGEFKVAEVVIDKVEPYFTEKGAEAMLKDWYSYGSFGAGTEWKAKVDHVEIKKDTAPNTFTFTANLICTHPSKAEQTLPIAGKSQYDEKGLLTYLGVSGETMYEMIVKNEELNQ